MLYYFRHQPGHPAGGYVMKRAQIFARRALTRQMLARGAQIRRVRL
jgi:hypothetical protein